MKKVKSVVILIMAILFFTISISGIIKLISKIDLDKSKISFLSFDVGGLTANGEYKETKESLYTKELIDCYGLEVKPKFNNQIKYQIYFYDKNEKFIESTNIISNDSYNELVPLSKYCRVVIYPINDSSLTKLEINKYARQLEIKVNKEQKFIYKTNLFSENIEESVKGKDFDTSLIDSKTSDLTGDVRRSTIIDIKSFNELHIIVKKSDIGKTIELYFADNDLNIKTDLTIIKIVPNTANEYVEIVVNVNTSKCGIVYNGEFIEVYGV